MNDLAKYEAIGNNTEIALLKFLQRAEVPIQHMIKNKYQDESLKIPFSPVRKTSIAVVE